MYKDIQTANENLKDPIFLKLNLFYLFSRISKSKI